MLVSSHGRVNLTPLHRAIAAGVLQAVAFCHGHAVAHGSLGSGSLLLSHFDDRRPEQLLVKLDNFGYARRMDAPDGAVHLLLNPMHYLTTCSALTAMSGVGVMVMNGEC